MGFVGVTDPEGQQSWSDCRKSECSRQTEIRGDDHRSLVIPFRQNLEKQFLPFLGKGCQRSEKQALKGGEMA